MYINTVHFFSKPWGGAENNPVRSSVSDQCYFYAKFVEGGAKGALPLPPKID